MTITTFSKTKSYVLLALLSVILAIPYGIVSILAGIAPILHLAIIWTVWLIFSARVKRSIAALVSPIIACLLYSIPSPNYWKDLGRLEFKSAWSDFQFTSRIHSDTMDSLQVVVLVNVIQFMLVWLIVYCSGRITYSLAHPPEVR